MSAFIDLVNEAVALGATKLSWDCDTRDWDSEPRREGRWTCRATLLKPLHTVYEAAGRTGEEALRQIVDFLRRIA